MSKIKVSYEQSTFQVYNSFIDNFIKESNPAYIKVYLYILRHINAGNSISFGRMSSDIGLIKSDIISAFEYWNEKNVLSYNGDPDNIRIEILNLDNPSKKEDKLSEIEAIPVLLKEEKETFFQSNESVSASYRANTVIREIHDDEKLAHLFSFISQMLNKNLTSNDYKIIYSFVDYLKLPDEVIIILFEYCISINKTNMRYIEKVAYSWADNGINTVELAEGYIKRKNDEQSVEAYYKHKFKISGREFTQSELKLLLSWINECKADEALIMAAYEKTVLNTGKLSFKYMDTIIKGETAASKTPVAGAGSKFKNYPDKYSISDIEKSRIERMMSEYEGGED